MKILILANKDDGLYQFRKDLIKKLLSIGNDIYVSVPFEKSAAKIEALGCKCIDTYIDRRGINPIRDLGIIRSYRKIVKNIKPDVVITYTIKPNIYGGMVCKAMKITYCSNITGLGTAFQNEGMLKRFVTILYRIALNKAKVVFFENPGNRDIIVENKIISKNRAYVLHGAGVNLTDYPYSAYPKDNTHIRFLFIGRVMREKGIDEFFTVAKRLKQENKNLEFDIVGRMEDDYSGELKELTESGIINYYGHQDDVKPFIRRSHCFVLPSWHEGMANTLLECGAMGRPLITSNIHGCLEAVQDGVTGYLCNVKDADDLYKKMKQFIALPYEKKAEMGKQSHEYVASVFDKKKVVEETVREIMR